MTDIHWEDPPPSRTAHRGNRGKWQTVGAELLAHPGKWALVHNAKSAGGARSNIEGRLRRSYPSASFQFASRKTADGTYDIYVRAVNEAEQ